MKYRHHVFVCITQRPPFAKPSCGQRDSPDVLAAIAEELESRNLLGEIGLTATQCLGPCESGPSMVVYPDGVWYAGVGTADVAELVERHLVGGEPVDRLRYTWPTG